MADTVLPNTGMTQPTIGADDDAWGGILNADLVILDGLFDNSTGAAAARPKLGLGPTSQNVVGVIGLAFPAAQNPSSDPNTLDDYEEGTWTPTLVGDTGASGQAYTGRSGKFLKVGRKVTCWGSLTLSTKGTLTGTFAVIGGLPYIPDNSSTVAVGGLLVSAGITAHYSAATYHQFGSNFVYIALKTSNSAYVLAQLTDISNGAKIDFTFEYLAAN